MAYGDCIALLSKAAGRVLTDDEVKAVFERIHRAALDIRAGRASPADVTAGEGAVGKAVGGAGDGIIRQAAERAAAELAAEAALKARQDHLQVLKLKARIDDVDRLIASGVKEFDAVEKTITRDYTGRFNLESLEQRVAGHKAYFGRRLLATWDALGDDFLGFFQDRGKLVNLLRELRGEDSGDALAKKGAKVFADVAEEARVTFNEAGGNVGRLDDWAHPQHHSQEKVAAAGRDAWVDSILPLLNRGKYVDSAGSAWSDAQLREFLGKAWDTIATNGNARQEAGTFKGAGKTANRHAEHRQIHFKDADSTIAYWEQFGERTAVEILSGHIDAMSKDIAFVEHFGPNPNVTFQTLRDMALRLGTVNDPKQTGKLEARAARLDRDFRYWSGQGTSIQSPWLKKTADGIAHLNTAGKLGGAVLASFFGDKPMMEAVAHLNNLPALQRWKTELSLLNPTNASDRRLLQAQGLMLESVRSGLQRFGEDLGGTSMTGKLANGVMRVTGMQAINDIRKGAFGASLMSAIGSEIKAGKAFGDLSDSDVRTLRNYGITEADWKIWQLAKTEAIAGADNLLTPDAIGRISDADLKAAGFGEAERRNAIVKFLGVVNTESEFAIVTPGWRERATFYAGIASERGTVPGEIARAVLQFKSFPWAFFQRGMDAVANGDTAASKAGMTAYLIASTTLAGAMLMQTREMLAGKDPKSMFDDKDWWKFWGQAFVSGGALGIYGDFLYGVTETRYGSGPIEALSGPTVGPLLELGIVQPLKAIKNRMEGRPTHLAAQSFQDIKGFIPGGNIWYLKTAMDHMVWQNVMESLSPGYLSAMRSKTMKETGQQWWWGPGDISPERAPDLGRAISR
jgi:hypothetical protein